ncbi:hypothetical protein QWJ34_20490 [Saccharibacillus sp. CPCC 101409]|nr:hypothetical protein [Saccharibacillus sp. CPCC 101409]MDO3412153.1 hypothetical protein [Saccharibacillus sp. CPCC 101409]
MFFVLSMAAIVISLLALFKRFDDGIGTGVKAVLFMLFYYFSPF